VDTIIGVIIYANVYSCNNIDKLNNLRQMTSIPYNLVYRTGVLYSVPRPGDMIGRGLVPKTGLIKAVGL
jgi:hypothetical protein